MGKIEEEDLAGRRAKQRQQYQEYQAEIEKAEAAFSEQLGDMQGKKVKKRTAENALAIMSTIFQRSIHQSENK